MSKDEIKKVEFAQFHYERISGLLDDYRDIAYFIKTLNERQKSLLRSMSREVQIMDRFISDSKLLGKLSDDFVSELNSTKHLVELLCQSTLIK